VLRRFFLSKHVQATLTDVKTNLGHTKLTLTLSLTAQKDPRHVIPGSLPGTVAACLAVPSLDDAGDGRCMIESKQTRTRCETVFPRYALVAKKNGPMIVYHACGKCAKDTRNAWWKNAYTRQDRNM